MNHLQMGVDRHLRLNGASPDALVIRDYYPTTLTDNEDPIKIIDPLRKK